MKYDQASQGENHRFKSGLPIIFHYTHLLHQRTYTGTNTASHMVQGEYDKHLISNKSVP